jgi:predicted MPP superfamily phosphohydrolase
VPLKWYNPFGFGTAKILITADLHYQEHWFRWLLSRAADCDLVCIAGDLLDMFDSEPRTAQAEQVSRWIRELAKVTRVAICSGNHDHAGRQISPDRAPVYEWLVGEALRRPLPRRHNQDMRLAAHDWSTGH